MTTISFVILALAVLRISDMLSNDANAGPFDVLHKIRRWSGVRYDEFSQMRGDNNFASGLICQRCNSVWLGAFVTAAYLLAPTPTMIVLMPFALSSIIILSARID